MSFGGNERLTESLAFFAKNEEKLMSKKVAAPRYTGTASEIPSLKAGAEFSAKCYLYAANVIVLAKRELKEGLEHATKKKLPKEFPFQMVFVSTYRKFPT